MKETSFLYRIMLKFGIIKKKDYNSVEALRARGVQIGNNVNLINTDIDFCHGFLVSIGNDVTLTGVKILAHDASTQIPFGVTKVGTVSIGDQVYVGHGTIILPNVHIGSRVIVGAGSVVTKDIPENSVAAGNPACIIGTYDAFLEKHKKQMENRTVYHTIWYEKTDKEKEQMRQDLMNDVGYDL